MWSKKRSCCLLKSDHKLQGLRILTKINDAAAAPYNANLVTKPAATIFLTSKSDHHSCYLKSCHLCHNPLPLNKEIYMYRGDLGFCSVECRERQIYLDETKELEVSIFSSFHRCRRRPFPSSKYTTTSVVFS